MSVARARLVPVLFATVTTFACGEDPTKDPAAVRAPSVQSGSSVASTAEVPPVVAPSASAVPPSSASTSSSAAFAPSAAPAASGPRSAPSADRAPPSATTVASAAAPSASPPSAAPTPTGPVAGKPWKVVASADAEPGYHCNADYPNKFTTKGGTNVTYPEAKVPGACAGDRVVATIPIVPTAAGPGTVVGTLSYGICDDAKTSCLMRKKEVTLAFTAAP